MRSRPPKVSKRQRQQSLEVVESLGVGGKCAEREAQSKIQSHPTLLQNAISGAESEVRRGKVVMFGRGGVVVERQ